MVFNEDSIKKWEDSKKDDDSVYNYVIEKLATIDEIKASDIFGDKIITISSVMASGRKPRPSSYIRIVMKDKIGNIPLTINGFDVEFYFPSKKEQENTIFM